MPLLPPAPRRLGLTLHVAASVGWLGAVLAFLPLAVIGRVADDPAIVRSAYLAMELIGRHALVPLSLIALASGVIQGLGTRWGLLRHYWVVAKLLIATISAAILLAYTGTLAALSAAAATMRDSGPVPELLRHPTAVLHAGLAAAALLAAITLSVFKPWGLTPYGRRRLTGEGAVLEGGGASTSRRMRSAGVALLLLLLLLLLMLLARGEHGPGRHALSHPSPLQNLTYRASFAFV